MTDRSLKNIVDIRDFKKQGTEGIAKVLKVLTPLNIKNLTYEYIEEF